MEMYALYKFIKKNLKIRERGCFMENSQNKVVYVLQILIMDRLESTPGED